MAGIYDDLLAREPPKLLFQYQSTDVDRVCCPAIFCLPPIPCWCFCCCGKSTLTFEFFENGIHMRDVYKSKCDLLWFGSDTQYSRFVPRYRLKEAALAYTRGWLTFLGLCPKDGCCGQANTEISISQFGETNGFFGRFTTMLDALAGEGPLSITCKNLEESADEVFAKINTYVRGPQEVHSANLLRYNVHKDGDFVNTALKLGDGVKNVGLNISGQRSWGQAIFGGDSSA